ncbi:aspartate dehydrogenase domain-containing protein [Rhodococcus sp. ARC_M6]|uniref:aspartate dehydrogenase domain-containing protein n=1 Tax=Rhodococcus sp. ARC_M6 TaxID=2928852 RepID=UPI001FB3F309|nr:aspartate dehydrogenase domain-containing protein [Rhodococcus sp. ARC_M6]MCJ0905622.1 DUF108 domain-containing protein [Rhodococcus sp. ARC_M6]
MARIGIIGSGGIARSIASYIASSDIHSLSFVQGRELDETEFVTATQITDQMLHETDIVIEAAHPDAVAKFSEQVLLTCDLMILSCAALVDDSLRDRLTKLSADCGTSLIVPHGALAGVESYLSSPGKWASATIEFVKSPFSLEPVPADTSERLVIYDGPVRGIAALYPRNVNAMVTFALATVGLDECRARLISDPAAVLGQLSTKAIGLDGSCLEVFKQQPMNGVSGTEMASSVLSSLQSAIEKRSGLIFG